MTIDPARHVKPVQAQAAQKEEVKYTTIGKYTYYESGDYVKIDLPIGAGADKEKNRIEVEFKERSLVLRVHDF